MSGLLIAMTAFSGATAAASLAGGITGFMKVKNHNDAARQGLKWVSPALLSLFLGTLLYLAQSILNFAVTNNYYGFVSSRSSFYIGIMAAFFTYLSGIGLFFALIETSFGILMMWNRAPKSVKGMRITAWTIVSLMLLLDLAYLIGSLVTARFSRLGYSGVFGIVSFTLEALHFVAMCWVLGMMVLVAKRAKACRNDEGMYSGENASQSPTHSFARTWKKRERTIIFKTDRTSFEKILPLYYASVSVAFFGSIWFLIYIITSVTIRPRYGYREYDPMVVLSVVIAIIGYVVPMISLVLLVALGARQQHGLWMTGLVAPKTVQQYRAVPQQYGPV